MKKTRTIRLLCHNFPGRQFMHYSNVHLAVQKGQDILWQTPGDAVETSFDIPVEVSEGKDGAPNFSGPFVHGKPSDKFLYLVWLDKKGDYEERFRRAKIKLQHLGWKDIETDLPIKASVNLTGSKGDPVCASLKPENIRWLLA